MKKNYLYFLFVLMSCFITENISAQCAMNASAYYGEMLPSNGCASNTAYNTFGPGQYFQMPVLMGGSYTISTCGESINTQITGYEGTNYASSIFYNDDNGPECNSTQASVTFTPNFTDYTRVMVSENNCLAGGSSSITVNVRQNNNLSFTSSSSAMCSGDTRTLTATPDYAPGGPTGSGDPGTFTGTGVSGNTFTAPTPLTASAVYTITYTFGNCSTTQDIIVYKTPAANAGPNAEICANSTVLQATPADAGIGAWTIISGPGNLTNPSSPTSTLNGLSPGSSTTLEWTVTNGPCSVSDQVVVSVASPIDVTVGQVGPTLSANNSGATYQWVDCDNGNAPITGATSQSFTPSNSGNYAVIITEGGCSDISTCFNVAYSGLDELASNIVVNIFPNPSEGKFNVELVGLNGNQIELRILDLQGRIVVSEKLDHVDGTHIAKIDISNNEAGVYIIDLIGEHGDVLMSRRIMKK